MKISVIITAGGSSNRFGSNKLLENLNGEPLIIQTIKKFLMFASEIVIPCSSELQDVIKKYYSDIIFVPNGPSRQESVYNALKVCHNPDYVLIHDGARPFVTSEIIQNTIDKVVELGAVAVGIPAIDTVKICDKNKKVLETPKRERVYYIQTPQAFKFKDILNAHVMFERELSQFSDDAALMEKMGKDVFIIEGSNLNRKITFREDLN